MSATGNTTSPHLEGTTRAPRPVGPSAPEPGARSARLAEVGRLGAERGLTIAVGLCAAGPVIAATVRSLHDGWLPAGDQANIATRAYDVFTSHTPLVGLHSDVSAVINHAVYSLGPMLFWLLALPARFGSPATLTLTMGILNTLAVVGVVVLARRRGGRVLMFMAAVAVALMCRSLASEVLHDIWNPSAGLLPFTLLIFLCWSLACGEHRLLPLTVLAASFVVQCQLAFLPPVFGLLAVGLAGLCLWRVSAARASPARAALAPESPVEVGAGDLPADEPSGTQGTALTGDAPGSAAPPSASAIWPWALAAVLVALACWSAPAIDQLEHRPGNLTEVVRTATAAKTALGAGVGWRAVVHAVGVPPWWLQNPSSPWQRKYEVRSSLSTLSAVSCLLVLCGLLAVAAVGLRRRRPDLVAGALIALILCLALATVAATTPATRLLAATLGYTMWWGSPVGMFVWLILAWSAVTLLAGRFPARRGARALAYAVGVAAAAAAAIAVLGAEGPDYHLGEYGPLKAVYAGLGRAVPAGRTVLLTASLSDATFRFKMAARFSMLRRGIRPLSPGSDSRLGSWYELDHRPYDCAVYLSDGRRRPSPRAVVVARATFVEGTASYPVSVWVSPAGCPRAPGS